MKTLGIVMLLLGLGIRPLGAPVLAESAVQEWALEQAETHGKLPGAAGHAAQDAQDGATWKAEDMRGAAGAAVDGTGEMAGPSMEAAAGEPVFNRAKCTCNGVPLRGKVKIVDAFADFRVQVVESFPDIDVQVVESFPDRCGQWQFVSSFPDFTIQMVSSFPDIKVRYVESFPGMK